MSDQAFTTRNPAPAPPGFEAFWRLNLQELLTVDPAPERGEGTGDTNRAVLAQMTGVGGAKVHVWFSGEREEGRSQARPLLVTAHGYGGQMESERIRRLSNFGLDVVGLDVRGFGLSRNSVERVSPYGYVLTGCESKETSILRGAVLDYIQAYRAAVAWFGPPSQVTFQGFSFAGGLSLMATAVLAMGQDIEGAPALPQVLACGVPTFGYLEKRLQLCEAGSGRELYRFLQERSAQAEEIKAVFEYFDTCHFAPYVKKSEESLQRMIFGVGEFDPIVPPETVYAIINALSSEPELHVMPCSHTDRPEEAEWVRWEGSWIRAAKSKDLRTDPPPAPISARGPSAQLR